MKGKIVVGMVMLFIAVAMASMGLAKTNVDMEWEGSMNSIHGKIENEHSKAEFNGAGNNMEGSFQADDSNYERVEVNKFEAKYENGGYYSMSQTNEQKNKDTGIYMKTESDGSGFVDAQTDEWRVGNDIKPHGYGGHGWSGTDSPMVGAEGNYNVEVAAGADNDKDGGFESSYYGNVEGNGKVGIGTHSAGSNDVLQASSVSGDMIVRGEGDASFDQEFQNTGHFDQQVEWN